MTVYFWLHCAFEDEKRFFNLHWLQPSAWLGNMIVISTGGLYCLSYGSINIYHNGVLNVLYEAKVFGIAKCDEYVFIAGLWNSDCTDIFLTNSSVDWHCGDLGNLKSEIKWHEGILKWKLGLASSIFWFPWQWLWYVFHLVTGWGLEVVHFHMWSYYDRIMTIKSLSG